MRKEVTNTNVNKTVTKAEGEVAVELSLQKIEITMSSGKDSKKS
jgi:hypothetical protein